MARCPAIGQKMKPVVVKSEDEQLKLTSYDACEKAAINERYEHAD
jgi:hypothetical protein